MRKAALASTLTLLLTLSGTSAVLGSSPTGSSPQYSGPAYTPIASDFIYPVGNPRMAPTFDDNSPNGYQITQMFNNSCDPAVGQGYYYAGQYFCGHTGVDLSDKQMGDAIHAVANGIVVYAGYNSTYGVMVRIQHILPDGSYVYSQYEHLLYGSLLVWRGEAVAMGQDIGEVGNTGFVTGPHLHFEIKAVNEDGVGYTFGNAALIVGYYDPISYIAFHTLRLLPTPTVTLPPPTATAAASATTATPVATPSAARSEGSTASKGGEQHAILKSFYKRYEHYVTVMVEHLNVRSGSGFQFAPLNSVRKGARLGYLGLTGNGWVHVALPSSVEGYVVRQWVQGDVLPALPPIAVASDTHGATVAVLDARYPARSAPFMHAMAIEPLRVGDKLPYLSSHTSWDKVVLPTGRIGWVLNWYVSEPQASRDIGGGSRNRVVLQAVRSRPRPASGRVRPRALLVAGPYVKTVVDRVNLRSGPRLAAPVIEAISRGTTLGLRGYHTSWAAVMAPDGVQGYVLGRFITSSTGKTPMTRDTIGGLTRSRVADHTATRTTTAPASPRRAAPRRAHVVPRRRVSVRRSRRAPSVRAAAGYGPPYVVVRVSAARLRAAPDRKATALLSASRDERLALHGAKGRWDRVETSGGVWAWVRSDLVR